MRASQEMDDLRVQHVKDGAKLKKVREWLERETRAGTDPGSMVQYRNFKESFLAFIQVGAHACRVVLSFCRGDEHSPFAFIILTVTLCPGEKVFDTIFNSNVSSQRHLLSLPVVIVFLGIK